MTHVATCERCGQSMTLEEIQVIRHSDVKELYFCSQCREFYSPVYVSVNLTKEKTK